METEVIDKITAICKRNFQGQLPLMFANYAPTGKLNFADLMTVLADAGVGNMLDRPLYANRIIAALDSDHDSMISLAELTAAIAAHGGG
jgi:hypothetical protein